MNDKFLDSDHEMSLDIIVQALNSELQWCYKHTHYVSPEFWDGFIKGIEQAKYIIVELAKIDFGAE